MRRGWMVVLLLSVVVPSSAVAQETGPRWWNRGPAGSGVVGLGAAVSASREMAVDGARELALADIARQREVAFRSERKDVVRESTSADSGTIERRGQVIVTAKAHTDVGPLRERVQTERLANRRWRAWVLLR